MSQLDILQDWKTRPCVLGTMHGKESVIAPLLKKELAIDVRVPGNFNTDYFGTFTRDVSRSGNQLEAARVKVLAAMKMTGIDLGIASEGSFGSHPSLPFLQSNLEIVLLFDAKNDLEIVGHYRSSNIQVKSQQVHTPKEAMQISSLWGFPEQGVILRYQEKSNRHIYKELTTLESLQSMTEMLLSKWYIKSVFLETDMRAHRCPARMKSIELATIDLVNNCKIQCQKCHAPGFVVTDVVRGLPCSECGSATDVIKTMIRTCHKCSYSELQPTQNATVAGPGDCPWCNP